MKRGDFVGLDIIDEQGEIRRHRCVILSVEPGPVGLMGDVLYRFSVMTETGRVINTVRGKFHEVIREA